MIQQPIRFDDGAAYERMMGAWSQLVGQVFLDWLSPATGQRWIDVGCGNGAFTEQLIHAARRSKRKASIRQRRSWPSRAPGQGQQARYFCRGMLWRCPSKTTGSMSL